MTSLEEHFIQQLQKAFVAGSQWCKQQTKPTVRSNKEIWISCPDEFEAAAQARKDYKCASE